MKSHPRQLPVPSSAAHDRGAVELLRVWASGGNQLVSLAVGLWPDPGNWGIMLVDLAKHIASSYAATGAMGHQDALERIRAGLDAEWGHATDAPTGGIVAPPSGQEPEG